MQIRELVGSAAPGLGLLSSYKRSWLSKDLVAGLVLTALLVPQGMAYAELAGLPPITGLYTSILCLVGYAIFGPSRILVLGPDSSLGPMIAATIIPIVGANGDPQRAVALASMLALLVGVMTVLAGIAKLGFVADLLSKPTQIGYMNGLALTILVGQLPKLFGFSVDADGFIPEAVGFFKGLADGEDGGGGARDRPARPGPHLRAPTAGSQDPCRPGGGGRLDPGRQRLQPGRPRSLPGRPTPQGLPAIHATERGDV